MESSYSYLPKRIEDANSAPKPVATNAAEGVLIDLSDPVDSARADIASIETLRAEIEKRLNNLARSANKIGALQVGLLGAINIGVNAVSTYNEADRQVYLYYPDAAGRKREQKKLCSPKPKDDVGKAATVAGKKGRLVTRSWLTSAYLGTIGKSVDGGIIKLRHEIEVSSDFITYKLEKQGDFVLRYLDRLARSEKTTSTADVVPPL